MPLKGRIRFNHFLLNSKVKKEYNLQFSFQNCNIVINFQDPPYVIATSNAICWNFSGFLFLGENYSTLIAVVPRWPCVVATVKSPAMPPSLVAIIIHCCAAVC